MKQLAGRGPSIKFRAKRETTGVRANPVGDPHVAPAVRRWASRFGLALVVAVAIGYAPGEALHRDPRAVKLAGQLDQIEADARELAAGNAILAREIEALRSDVGAIEDRARADLGMVYPDEVVLRVRRGGEP